MKERNKKVEVNKSKETFITKKDIIDKVKSLFNSRYKRYLIMIFIIAILLRVIYVLKINPMKNQHDLGVLNAAGGIAYYQSIFQNHELPQHNYGQFYHPPLHYILGSIWMIPFSVYTDDFLELVNYTKFLTLIYSIIAMILFYKILGELHVRKKYKAFLITVFNLLPINILLAGSLNNDCLAYTLSIWTILRLIKWRNKSDVKNLVWLAIAVGTGVMTKTSCALLAIPIICVFIERFIRELKKHKKQVKEVSIKYISLYILFGTISLPIGLCFHIRNLLKFKQPLLYVLNINNKQLYTGNYSKVQRFLPDISEFRQMFANPFENHNIPAFTFKTFLFGEWNTWTVNSILYYSAFISVCILAIMVSVILIVNLYRKSKRYNIWRFSLLCLTIFNIISFVKMNIDLPYGCSMDFRYLLSTVITSILIVYFEYIIARFKNKKIANIIFSIVFIIAIIMIVAANIIIVTTSGDKFNTY